MSRMEQQFASGEEFAMGEGSGTRETSKNKVITKSGREISICPMCNGKGYYEEVATFEVGGKLNAPSIDSEQKVCTLPNINQDQQNVSQRLEHLFKPNNVKTLSRVSEPPVSATGKINKPISRFPPVVKRKGNATAASDVNSLSNSVQSEICYQMVNFLPAPSKSDKHPADAARLAAIKLNRSDWETKKAGLEECLQLAHFNPEELEPYMNIVYRTISSLMNSFRPRVALFLCQAAREFFICIRSTCRPEFDELVFSLLNRTADTNRHIRLFANDALDQMIAHIPTVYAVRPIVDKGPIHKNPLVRSATARLLANVVAQKTPNAILTHPTLRDTCKRILETAAILLADGNLDTRAAAKKLFQGFLNEEDFESLYYAEVDEKLRKKVNRAFIELKYKRHGTENSKDTE